MNMRDCHPNRRQFLKTAVLGSVGASLIGPDGLGQQTVAGGRAVRALSPQMRWLQSARVFLVDGYAYPFTPDLEFDAEALAEAMADVKANVVRFATMGKYATIQGVAFSRHPRQGKRDLLAETVAACKPRGIRVVPYISTMHKLAWSMVTRDYPQYAHVSRPGGGPARSPFGSGEDHGTVCWNTPYRQAYLDLIEHVVRDYEIDGIYFDSWMACYFWPRPGTCYCDGCRKGFATGASLEIPFHEKLGDYTSTEQAAIRRYHAWYQDQLIGVLGEVRRIVKRHRDIPLIYNINNPERLMGEDPRVPAQLDAFLYERSQSMLHRAEGVSLARATGLAVWPYVSSRLTSRVAAGGLNVQQEIFVTAMFGGGPIVYSAYQFVRKTNDREILRRPFGIIARHEDCFQGVENLSFVAVVWGSGGATTSGHHPERPTANVRSSTLGAFAACLRRHVQVASVLQDLLDDPARLARYKVVYLAGVPHLTTTQIRNLRDFVAAGGGLVVSHDCSLWRQEGPPLDRPVHLFRLGFAPAALRLVRQERFGLEELIRVRPVLLTGERAALVEKHTSDHPGFQDLYLRMRLGSKLVPVFDYQPVVPLDGTEVSADIVVGESQPVLPGIVLSRHGKGRVAYVAPALESVFLQTNLGELADVIASLVARVSPEPAPFTVHAPDGLIANLTVRDNQRVLHMTNWTGNKLEQPGLNESWLTPIENVHVRLRKPPGRRIERVALLVEAPFEQKDLGEAVEITLPRVGAYQAIRFTCAG
ncbi:MAG: hypothetical protein NT105_20675 [Verrucomicrobia bacterium]|nr:hypothetical protein [Verrucomicrobiota bacterium]